MRGLCCLLFCVLNSLAFANSMRGHSQGGNYSANGFEDLPLLPTPFQKHYDPNFLKNMVARYQDPKTSPDQSCMIYSRSYRADKIPAGYLEMVGASFLESLCQDDRKGSLFASVQTRQGDYFDVFRKIESMPGKPSRHNLTAEGLTQIRTETKFILGDNSDEALVRFYTDMQNNLANAKEQIALRVPGDPKNLAVLYSMLLPLGTDETGAYPLTPKHTDASSEAEWEAGLFHLASNLFYADINAPSRSLSDVEGKRVLADDLKRNFYQYLAGVKRISDMPKEQALPALTNLCGLDQMGADYFQKYFADYKQRNPKADPNNRFKNLSDESFDYERDFSPNAILTSFRSLFEEDKKHPQTVLDFVHEAARKSPDHLITEKFLKSNTDFSMHFVNTFRKMQFLCPKFATKLTAHSLRLNATHQGSIKRDSLYPHCLKMFEEMAQSRSLACVVPK
jgi:hypothetical protein